MPTQTDRNTGGVNGGNATITATVLQDPGYLEVGWETENVTTVNEGIAGIGSSFDTYNVEVQPSPSQSLSGAFAGIRSNIISELAAGATGNAITQSLLENQLDSQFPDFSPIDSALTRTFEGYSDEGTASGSGDFAVEAGQDSSSGSITLDFDQEFGGGYVLTVPAYPDLGLDTQTVRDAINNAVSQQPMVDVAVVGNDNGGNPQTTVSISPLSFFNVEEMSPPEMGEPDFSLPSPSEIGLQPPSSFGNPFTATIPVTNVGDAPGSFNLEGPGGISHTSQPVQPGESVSPSFDIPADFYEQGIEFSIPGSGESVSLDIPRPEGAPPSDAPSPPDPEEIAEFALGIPNITPPQSPGDLIGVDVPVENIGNAEGEPTVRGPGNLSKSKPVAPGEQRSFSFDVPTDFYGESVEFSIPGTDASAPVELPTPPGGSPPSPGDLAPPEFEITDVGVPNNPPIPPATPEIPVTVKNVGGQEGEVLFGIEGVNTIAQKIPAGGTVTEQFGLPLESPGPRQFTVVANNQSTGDRVSTDKVMSVPSPSDVEDAAKFGSDTIAIGVGPLESEVALRVTGAYAIGNTTTIETEVTNTPVGDRGYAPLMYLDAEIGSESTRLEVNYDGVRNAEVQEQKTLTSSVKVQALGPATVTLSPTGTEKTATVNVPPGIPKAPEPCGSQGISSPQDFTPEQISQMAEAMTAVGKPPSGEVPTVALSDVHQGWQSGNVSPEAFSLVLCAWQQSFPIPKPTPNISVSNISPPSNPTVGNPLSIEYTVENTGNAPGEKNITITSAGEQIAQQTASLQPGESTTKNVEFTPQSAGPLPISVGGVSRELGISGVSNLAIQNINLPDSVRPGEAFTAAIELANTGSAPTQFRLETPAGESTGELAPGESTTIEEQFTPQSLGALDFTTSLENATSGEVVDSQSPSVSVVDSVLAIQNISLPDTPPVGEQFTADVGVQNTGDAPGTATLSGNGVSETLTVPPGTTQTVSVPLSLPSPGENTLSFDLLNPQTGSVIDTTETTVGASTPTLLIGSVDAPDTAPINDTASITATVENTGGAEGQYRLTIEDSEFTGSLPPEETASHTADIQNNSPAPLPVSVVLYNSQTGGEVDRRQLTIPTATPSFQIENIELPSIAPRGNPVTAVLTVANTGNGPGEAVVTMMGNEQSQTIPAGETRDFTFNFTKETSTVEPVEASVTWPQTGEVQDNISETIDAPAPEPEPPEPPTQPPQQPEPPQPPQQPRQPIIIQPPGSGDGSQQPQPPQEEDVPWILQPLADLLELFDNDNQ